MILRHIVPAITDHCATVLEHCRTQGRLVPLQGRVRGVQKIIGEPTAIRNFVTKWGLSEFLHHAYEERVVDNT